MSTRRSDGTQTFESGGKCFPHCLLENACIEVFGGTRPGVGNLNLRSAARLGIEIVDTHRGLSRPAIAQDALVHSRTALSQQRFNLQALKLLHVQIQRDMDGLDPPDEAFEDLFLDLWATLHNFWQTHIGPGWRLVHEVRFQNALSVSDDGDDPRSRMAGEPEGAQTPTHHLSEKKIHLVALIPDIPGPGPGGGQPAVVPRCLRIRSL